MDFFLCPKLNLTFLRGLGTVLVQGGSDTTAAFLEALVLLLVKFPEVQQKAQKELDDVVGLNRTPTVEDVEKMPYIQAIIHEVTNHLYS